MLLRVFGAKLAAEVRIRSTVTIEIPWNLTVGTHTAVGDHAILYCLGPVTLGRYVTISQYAHLCAGTHELDSRDMKLLRPPIVIGDDAWIATDAFVGPGVTIGEGTVVGARSSVFKDLPEWVIAVGNPAKPIRKREFKSPRLPAEDR
jgi:putative colanic acid biosynthesis acetyltransferase WcaF